MTGITGTIGITSSQRTTYPDFVVSLLQTYAHEMARGQMVKVSWAQGTDVVGNMNLMSRNLQGDWLWILGDDHTWDSNLLMRLLAHDVDVIVPNVLKRTPPFMPVAFMGQIEDGSYAADLDMAAEGLVELHAAGSAGMLVKRHVLEAIPEPVFESHGGLNEDLTFCAKVRDAGYRIWIDPACRMGHIGSFTVWPRLDENGVWQMELDYGNDVKQPLHRHRQLEPVPA